MQTLLLFLMVIGLMFIGVPIAVSLGLASVFFLLLFSDGSLASIAQTLFAAFDGHYTLLAIPFFILASGFMSTGGVARRIIRFSIAVVGHVRGGLAIASVFACMLFAALSGSSPATVVAIGTIVIAGMRQVGYTKEFAAGVVCSAGTLGILIPPSIVMVVYSAATDVSVGRMFLAGVIPGLLAGLMLMIGIYVMARVKGLPSQPWAGWGEVGASALDSFWGLFLIVIILGGIYGGIFTPTEAAAVAAVYAFLVANFIYRDMGPLHVEDGKPISIFRKPQALITAWVHPDTKNAPDHCEYSAVDRWPVYGTLWSDHHCGAVGISDCNGPWYRSYSLGHHHGREYGDRHDHTACWPESLCDRRGGKTLDDECGQSRIAIRVNPRRLPDSYHLRTLDLNRAAACVDGP